MTVETKKKENVYIYICQETALQSLPQSLQKKKMFKKVIAKTCMYKKNAFIARDSSTVITRSKCSSRVTFENLSTCEVDFA